MPETKNFSSLTEGLIIPNKNGDEIARVVITQLSPKEIQYLLTFINNNSKFSATIRYEDLGETMIFKDGNGIKLGELPFVITQMELNTIVVSYIYACVNANNDSRFSVATLTRECLDTQAGMVELAVNSVLEVYANLLPDAQSIEPVNCEKAQLPNPLTD